MEESVAVLTCTKSDPAREKRDSLTEQLTDSNPRFSQAISVSPHSCENFRTVTLKIARTSPRLPKTPIFGYFICDPSAGLYQG